MSNAHRAAHDLDAQVTALRDLAIACRSSVKSDLNAYERLLIAKQKHGERETPTYVAAEAEAQRLFELLAKIDALAQTAFPITINAPELKPGEKFVGVILSADGSRRHALILLPGEIEDANWKKASEWATRQGGELPDRVEGALLFATLQDEFKPELYWTREQHAGLDDFAWCQYFSYGHQNYGTLKDNQCRARAVRRLAI